MKTITGFARMRFIAVACLACVLAGCMTRERPPRYFFATPAREVDQLRLPGQREFDAGEAIILVASGEGFDGQTLKPEVFRLGVLQPVYVGKPMLMTPGTAQWWSLGILEPGKYLALLRMDNGPTLQQVRFLVGP